MNLCLDHVVEDASSLAVEGHLRSDRIMLLHCYTVYGDIGYRCRIIRTSQPQKDFSRDEGGLNS